MKGKYLIAGATGAIGREIVKQIYKKGGEPIFNWKM